MKLNEAGFAKRRQLLEAQTKKNHPPVAGVAESPVVGFKGKDKVGKKGESSRKRARDSGVDAVSECQWLRFMLIPVSSCPKLDYLKRSEVKIVIPDTLKLQLVDDWENVTKNNQVG